MKTDPYELNSVFFACLIALTFLVFGFVALFIAIIGKESPRQRIRAERARRRAAQLFKKWPHIHSAERSKAVNRHNTNWDLDGMTDANWERAIQIGNQNSEKGKKSK